MKYANIINKKMQLVWNSILMGVKKNAARITGSVVNNYLEINYSQSTLVKVALLAPSEASSKQVFSLMPAISTV